MKFFCPSLRLVQKQNLQDNANCNGGEGDKRSGHVTIPNLIATVSAAFAKKWAENCKGTCQGRQAG